MKLWCGQIYSGKLSQTPHTDTNSIYQYYSINVLKVKKRYVNKINKIGITAAMFYYYVFKGTVAQDFQTPIFHFNTILPPPKQAKHQRWVMGYKKLSTQN